MLSDVIWKACYWLPIPYESTVLILHWKNLVNNIVDLGVNFDNKVSFRDHIVDKTNKAYSVFGVIKRNFDNLPKDAFLMLYKSMVQSHLEYAGVLWNPYIKGDITYLEKVQMTATKLHCVRKKVNP